jgi:hypothetical protein
MRGRRFDDAWRKNDLKHLSKSMCIPQVDREYVARKEAVPDRYAEAPDKRPVVCLEESPVQLIGQFRPGRVSSNVTIKIVKDDHPFVPLDVNRPSTLSGGR